MIPLLGEMSAKQTKGCLNSENLLPPFATCIRRIFCRRRKRFFVQKRLDIVRTALYNTTCKFHIAVLCNGSTADSDSVCRGSNPFTAATKKSIARCSFLFSHNNRIRTCEGLCVQKTVRWTVFSTEREGGTETQSVWVSRAKSMQGVSRNRRSNPFTAATKKEHRTMLFFCGRMIELKMDRQIPICPPERSEESHIQNKLYLQKIFRRTAQNDKSGGVFEPRRFYFPFIANKKKEPRCLCIGDFGK